ncbi:MAG: DMT family transporter [Candidatus Micrarchaeia archaeon]
MQKMGMRFKAYVAISIAVLELSFLPIFSGMQGSLNIWEFLLFIFSIATIVSFALVALRHKLNDLKHIISNRKAMLIVLTAGLFNYALPQLFLVIGIRGTNPIVGSLVAKLWPLFLALMLPFVLKTRLRAGQVAALFIGLLAVYVLLAHGTMFISMSELPYILVLIGYCLSTAFSNLIIKGHNYDIFSQVFLFNLFSMFFALGMIVALQIPLAQSISIKELIAFLFLGAVSYSSGALLYFYTLKTLNPLIATNATYVTPLLTALFSYIILGTPFYAYYGAAFALLVVALAMQHRYSSKAPEYLKKSNTRIRLFDITGAFLNTKNAELQQRIWGGGRAIATKLDKSLLSDEFLEEELKLASAYGCMLFKVSKEFMSEEELEFVNEMLDRKEHEEVLVWIGNPKDLENLFDHVSSMIKPY